MVRYFISSDDDGHKYIVRADKEKEWHEFLQQAYSGDEDAPSMPPEDVAASLTGHYSNVTFTDPLDDSGKPIPLPM